MTADFFITAIKANIHDHIMKEVLNELNAPILKYPTEEDINLSTWYNNLDREAKLYIHKIIIECIESTIFKFLCIIDGVTVIEDTEEKGELELYYVKGEQKILLNNFNQNKYFLHDKYKEILSNQTK